MLRCTAKVRSEPFLDVPSPVSPVEETILAHGQRERMFWSPPQLKQHVESMPTSSLEGGGLVTSCCGAPDASISYTEGRNKLVDQPEARERALKKRKRRSANPADQSRNSETTSAHSCSTNRSAGARDPRPAS